MNKPLPPQNGILTSMTINERPVANPVRQAIRDIKLMTSTYRGLAALSDALQEVQDLDSMIAERKANVEKLLAQKSELEARVAQLDSEVKVRLSDAEAKAHQMVEAAADVKARAHSLHVEADARLAAATADAARIIADARINAKQAVSDEIAAIKARL
jgi:F0F1-type ATP synthase membrane subunit b/b'